MVGLIPLFAVETLEPDVLDRLPGFKRRMQWFIDNRPDLARPRHLRDHRPRRRRAPPAVDRRGGRSCVRVLSPHARRERVPLAARHPRALALPPRPSLRAARSTAIEHRVDYEPAESTTGHVRRQLELARPDLVPGELPADRVAAEVPSLLRRRPQGRVPDRLRPAAEPVGGGRRAVARSHPPVPARPRRPPARLRIDRAVPARPTLARPDSLLRVLPRRQRARGIGASHQTGWTGLVAKLIEQSGE